MAERRDGAHAKWPRRVGALMFALAAVAAAVGPIWAVGDLTPQALRETGPLAAALGALLGVLVITKWPETVMGGAALGALSAAAGLVLFCALYLFGDTVIVAILGGDPQEEVARAVDRLAARLPLAAPAALSAFAIAGVVLWVVGRLSRPRPKTRAPRPSASAR